MTLKDIFKLINGNEIWVLNMGATWVSAFVVSSTREVVGTANFSSRESLISKIIRPSDVASHNVISE